MYFFLSFFLSIGGERRGLERKRLSRERTCTRLTCCAAIAITKPFFPRTEKKARVRPVKMLPDLAFPRNRSEINDLFSPSHLFFFCRSAIFRREDCVSSIEKRIEAILFLSPPLFSAENKFSCRRSGKGEKLNREEDGPRRTEESLYFRGKSRVSVGEKRWREAIVGYSARAATREEKFFLVHIYIYASGTACRL